MSEDESYYRRQLEVASERDLDSLTGIHTQQLLSEEGMEDCSRDQVPKNDLAVRQTHRRHQMSPWGIEFQSSPRGGHSSVTDDHAYALDERQAHGARVSTDHTNRSSSSERQDKKGLGKRSRTRISAEGDPDDNDDVRLVKSNIQEQKTKKKKKKSIKNQLLTSTEASTGTYTIDNSVAYENPSYQSDPASKPPSRNHVKKRRKPKHTETPTPTPDSVDCDSLKNNGTYTVPGSDSSTQYRSPSKVPRIASMGKMKRQQSKREINRMNRKELADFVSKCISHCECNHYVTSSQRYHTKKIQCDSFGEICFQGFGNESKDSPYLRLDPATNLVKIWTILTDYWLLPKPTLLISVTGGAKQLHLRPRVETLFQRGLIHAATSTGAWIITGGTNAGVMKCVGEAVRDYLLTADTTEQTKLVALGIASWGVIANKDALDGYGVDVEKWE